MARYLGILFALFSGSAFAQLASTRAFPDGCGTPFQERADFIDFFKAAAEDLAVGKGAASPGVPELFAVIQLENRFSVYYLQKNVESPLTKLVVENLCRFKAFHDSRVSSEASALTSQNPELGQHLLKIAAPLYRDVRKMSMEIRSLKIKERNELEYRKGRAGEISRAQNLGRSKVSDVIEGL